MKLAKGDLFRDAFADVILVTTNDFVKSNGSLVMGRGAAAQLAKMYPEVPFSFGKLIKGSASPSHYGVVIDPMSRGSRMYGAFQVKHEWFSKADLTLITYSCLGLENLAKILPNWRFALNFPGIGNGQLSREDVLPIIENFLPDNVEVWEF